MSNAKRTMAIFGRRATTVVLSALMVFSSVPTAALAEEWEEAQELAAQLSEQDTSVDNGDTAASENTEQAAQSGEESSQSEPGSDTSSAEQNSGEQEASSQSSEQATQADIALSGLDYATVKLADGQSLSTGSTKVTVPTSADFKFTVEANSGYSLKAVKLTVNGAEHELTADDNGYYTIPAADILSGASLALETEEASDAANNSTSTTSITDDSDDADAQGDDSYINPIAEGTDSEYYISGPTAVTMGESITLTFNGPEVKEWDIYSDNGAPLEQVSTEGNSVTYKAKTSWVFDGASTTVKIKVQYQDPNNEYGTLTSEAFAVTINKRTFYVADPPTKHPGEDHFWTPTLIDSATGEEIDVDAALNGGFLAFEYYRDGERIDTQKANQWHHDESEFSKDGVYTVVVKAGSGWTYKNDGDITVEIPDAKGENTPYVKYIYVGENVTLSGGSGRSDSWKNSDSEVASLSYDSSYWGDASKATATGLKVGVTTVTHTYKTGSGKDSKTNTDTFTVHVLKKPVVSKLEIYGDHEVEQFKSITLTTNVDTDVTWTSSDPSVATIDANGKVVGVKEGTVTITATTVTAEGKVLTATHDVTVTVSSTSATNAWVFFQNSPTANPDTNSTAAWFPSGGEHLLGIKLNLEGATFSGSNSYDNVTNRVVSWPDGSTGSSWDLKKDDATYGTYWTSVFNAWKSTLEKEQGTTITEDDVEYIRLTPYKISKNSCGYHLDCKVEVKCSKAVNAIFYLQDAGSTGFAQYAAATYKLEQGKATVSGPSTTPADTKTYKGVTYKFMGWYSDQACTQAVSFPVTVTGNANYYAKYVPMDQTIQVNYYLEGTTTPVAPSDTLTGLIKGKTVTVAPKTVTGYTPVSTEAQKATAGTDTEINFYYTANEVDYTVQYLWNGTDEPVADSETVANGKVGDTVTVWPKAIEGCTAVSSDSQSLTLGADASKNVVKFYYYKNLTLTANSDSVEYDGNEHSVTGFSINAGGVTVDDVTTEGGKGTDAGEYEHSFAGGTVGKVDTTNKYVVAEVQPGKLTISPSTKAVTIKVAGATGGEKYNGKKQTVSGYTVDKSTLPAGVTADKVKLAAGVTAEVTGTNAGTYGMVLTSNSFVLDSSVAKNYSKVTFEVTDGQLSIAKRDVTIWSQDGHKNYDGKTLQRHDGPYVGNEKQYEKYDATTKTTTKVDMAAGDGFVEGEGFKASSSVVWDDANNIAPGVYNNKFTVTFNEKTNTDNYNITYQYGKLYVENRTEKYEVTVTANSGTVTYDGEKHTVSGLTRTTYTNDKGVTFTITGLSASAEGTDAGEYAARVTGTAVVTDAAGNNVTSQFKVKTVDGKLTINKKAATITAGSAEKEYDGKALTTNEFSTGGFVEGQGIASATIEGSQTVAGTSSSTVKDKSWKAQSGTNLDNYTITTQPGTLTVKDRTAKYKITLEGITETKTYNGADQTVWGVKTDTFTFNGETFTVKNYKSDVTGKDAGDYVQTITSTNKDGNWTIKDANGNDVSDQFSVTTTSGKLTIAPKDVTITSGSASKTYDGAALTKNEASVTAGGFVEGEEAGVSYTYFGSQTNKGSSSNTFEVVFDGTKAKDSNYNVTKKPGTLTVNAVTDKVTVTITEHGDTYTYDGTEKTVTGYDVSSGNELYTADYFSFNGNATVTGTDAGTYNMELKADDFHNTSANFINVEFVIVDGTLTISPRPVTLTSATESKTYDGTALTNENVTVGGQGFVDGQGASYDVTGTITNAGSVDNEFTYTLNEGTKAKNYNITKTEGKLTVSPVTDAITVAITGKTGSDTYNGKVQGVEGYGVSISGSKLYTKSLVKFNGTAKAEGIDAGTYSMGLKAEQFSNADAANFTNVTFKVASDGSYTINKADVTLRSADLSKPYDGDALTNGGTALATETGWAEGEGATYTFTGSQTAPGSSANAFSYALKEGTKESNYNICKTEGTLTVTSRGATSTITVEAKSATTTYDGKEHEAAGVETYEFTVDGKKYTVSGLSTEDPKKVDAGTYSNNITGTPVVKDEDGNNVTSEFAVETQNGSLTINKAAVTLKSASGEWTYDGAAHSKNEMETVSGFADGEGASFTYGASVTNVSEGEVENAFTYTLNANTKANNYEITTEAGALKVNPASDKVTVTVTEDSAAFPYDGSEHTAEGYTFSTDNSLYGESCFSFVGKADHKVAKGTAVGQYDMKLEAGDFENVSANFSNVEFVIVDGQLVITPAAIDENGVVWTKQDLTKVYDAKALTAYAATAKDKYGNDLDVEFSTDDETWTANAKDVSLTHAGSVTVYLRATNDNYSEGGYATTTETITVSKRKVTIASATDSKTYDGTPLTNGQITLSSYDYQGGNGFVSGEGVDATATGTITNVGETPNTIEWSYKSGTESGDYDVTVTPGTLTVTADASEVVVTVKGNSESVVYDGKEHAVAGYEVVSITGGEGRFTKDDVTLNEGVDLSVSATDVAVDENGSVVAYAKKLNASDFKSTNGNFSNVKFVVDSSAPSVSLTVTKRPVMLTSGSAEKPYDGTPLTNSEVTATEFGEGVGFVGEQGFTAETTGTQTNAGTSKNAFTYTLNNGTSANNYSITKAEGNLTVTKLSAANLNLKGTNVTAVYDATSHAAGTATVTPKDNEGSDLNVDVTIEYQLASDPNSDWYRDPSSITQMHATTEPVVVNVRATSANFDGCATATETITVTKRPVQISTKSASKVYDGTALTTKNDWDRYEIKPDKDGGFVYDDYVKGSDGYPILECTGSQTEVGSSANTINYQIKSDRLDDYNISEPSLGTLTVLAQSIDPSTDPADPDKRYAGATVNDPSDTTYDGQTHKWEPTVKNGKGETLAKGTDYTVTYERDGKATDDFTNAGTITVTITGKDNYAGSVTKTYKITPAPLKVSTPDATKVYDGTALTAAATSANISGLVAGETATVKATGSITEVGSTANTYSGIEWGTAKESNYYVQSQSEGTLKVLAQSIDPSTDPADPDKRYDGAKVDDPSDSVYNGTANKWEPTVKNGKGETLAKGTDYTVTYERDGKATDDFTNAGTITVTITGKDNYAGSVTKTYVINKAKVSVATADATKVYDGTALTKADGATISGLVAGETAGIVGTGSITEVGSTSNTYAITWAGEGNSYTAKESNYEVSGEALGTLSITESADEIVVTTTGGEFTYDGKAHGATVTVGTLPTGYSVKTASSNATATDVTEGVTATADNLVIVNASGKDVTSSLNIKKVDGTIKVNPAELTVTTYGDTKAYDGTALTAGGKIEGLVNQEAAELVTNGSITEVGETKNTYTINWNDNAKQSNYKVVTENIGTLKVTPATTNLFVVPAAATKVYDGKALTSSTANVYGSLPKDYTYEYTLKGSQTEVGTGYVEVDTFKILNKDGKDVTSQFSGYNTEFKNTLTVTQRPVTVTSANGSKTYDGSALEAHSATASETAEGTGMVEGESFDFDYTGSQTEKGSSSNYFTAKDSTTAKVSNYNVTYVYGTLEVTAQSIKPGTDPEPNPDYKGVTVSDPSNTTYDGQAHKWEPEVKDANGNALAKGTDYTVTYKRDGQVTANFTDAGTITVEITGTGNYSGTVTKTYVISPKGYSVTTESASKVYDNKPLTAPGKVEGIVDGETYTLKMAGSRTEVGTSDNTYEILWTGTAKQGNYVRTSESIGKLTVTEYANEIVVTTTGGTSTYDGQTHGATVAVTGLPEGYRVQTAASSATATDVTDAEGVTATADKLVIVNGQGKDVTKKLKITKVDGAIKVTPATLTVVTNGAEKPYDGEALTAGGTVTGFVNGESAELVTIGSQTYVGSSENGYEIKWNSKTKEKNYTVTATVGTLVVTAKGTNNDKVITKRHTAGTYKLGETVEFTITATNIYDTAKTLTISEMDGVKLSQSTFTNVAPGESVTATATYTIQEKDIRAGTFVNVASVKFSDGEEFDNTDTVTVEEKKAHLSVEKVTTSTPKNGSSYALGETISYDVTVTNDGNITVNDVTTTDTLPGAKLAAGQSANVGSLAPGASVTVKYVYTVTEADVVAGKVTNGATASGSSSAGKADVTPDTTTDEVESGHADLVVTKKVTSTPANGSSYALGETIEYAITVTNKGNLTARDFQVTDDNADNFAPVTIGELAPGATTQAIKATHVVTSADVLAGKVTNSATVSGGKTVDPSAKPKPTPGEVDADVVSPDTTLEVTKVAAAAKEGAYKLGEEVSFTITVTNKGNVAYNNVKVLDEQTGLSETIETLAVNESRSFTTTHTITEADLVKGSYANTATATADPVPDPKTGKDVTPSGTGTETISTEEVEGAITVTKTAANGSYAAGDTVEYTITVANTGNVTVYDINVVDAKTGLDETVTLAKGETRSFTTSYVVTDEDIAAGTLSNTATAKGTDPKGGEVDGTDTEVIDDATQPDPDNPEKPTLKRELNVSELNDVEYNGQSQQLAPAVTDKYGNLLVEGTDYTLSYSADTTNVGQVTVTVTGIGNYAGVIDRSYNITPAALTITTGSAVKSYDGTALTNADIRVDGLKGNDAVSAATTGSITEVGSATNTYAIDWLETDKNNYTVTENLGELVVTAAAVVPNTPGNSPASPDGTVIDAIADSLADAAAAFTGEQDGEQIFDAENPLGKNAHAACWVHFYMIIGMVVTLLYGLSVDARRRRFSGKLAGQLNDVLGGTEGSEA